jgi:hypothetical protein
MQPVTAYIENAIWSFSVKLLKQPADIDFFITGDDDRW